MLFNYAFNFFFNNQNFNYYLQFLLSIFNKYLTFY